MSGDHHFDCPRDGNPYADCECDDLDAMYEPHPIPDDYPRTRRTAIVAGWLVFIAFLVYAARNWRMFL